MSKSRERYVDLDGREWNLTNLDAEERQLVAALRKRAKTHPEWSDFDNFWFGKVAAFYDARGLARNASMQTAVYHIAQDLSGRLAIASGFARESDYRDELREIIRTRFNSRREFCDATGLSEDMLSHVLAGRKNLALDTLVRAMRRIGYRVRIAPCEQAPSKKNKRAQEVA